ncbi:MAG: hypothetical protein CVV44_03870 [Spirochaetae bacterium HGW-Spirochaetae-1]|jgi:cell division protein FtsB|nr:MAG: hypothetical protein CVV44_03870 [Spirochaetae bacterium HGW-Spirochaetae-1]
MEQNYKLLKDRLSLRKRIAEPGSRFAAEEIIGGEDELKALIDEGRVKKLSDGEKAAAPVSDGVLATLAADSERIKAENDELRAEIEKLNLLLEKRGVKELKAENDELKAENEKLKAENDELQKLLEEVTKQPEGDGK